MELDEKLWTALLDHATIYALKGHRRFRTGNIVVSVTGNPEGRDLIYVGNVMFTFNGRKLYDLVDVEYKKYRNDVFLLLRMSYLIIIARFKVQMLCEGIFDQDRALARKLY